MTSKATTKARSPLPILQGLLPIDPARVSIDVIAGATLAALAIPEVMGYSKIAGMPVVTGLYTLLLPVLLFAIFGSSRHLVVGADSASAAILATGLVATGAVAGSPEYIALAGLAALMCGVLLLAARLLRLGFIANFLSRSVLIGFLTGVGIQVAMGQVAGIFGVDAGSGTTLEKFANTLRAIAAGDTITATLAVSIAVLVTIVGLGAVNKKIPGALIAVVGSIVLSEALDLAAKGVTTLGTIQGGLPAIGLPQDVITTDNIDVLLPMVIAIVVVILAQSAATSRAYAIKYGDSFEENVDLVGLGLASLGAGVSGTFVVNGSPTKTEMVDGAGGRSQLSQLTAGAIVVVVLLFLTGPLANMPNAVLASVVFLIGIKLIDYKGMSDILRVRLDEFVVALLTAATVVIIGVEQGIILAIVLSIIIHIQHSYHPYDRLVSLTSTGEPTFTPVEAGTQALPGLVIYRFGASLYYANATRFTAEILDLVDKADPPLKWLCLSASAMGDVDYSGADAIRAVFEELQATGRDPRPERGRPGRDAAARRVRSDRQDREGEHLRDDRRGGRGLPAGDRGDAVTEGRAVADREKAGEAARAHAPLSGVAGWRPVEGPARTPSRSSRNNRPLGYPDLVPVRYGRMSASPFAFYRGAALPMAADLATVPVSGFQTQLCGDAHLSNFGLFASPERDLEFDVTDFDETLVGPWEWDLLRLAAQSRGVEPGARVRRAQGAASRSGRGRRLPGADAGLCHDARDRRLLREGRRGGDPRFRRRPGAALSAHDDQVGGPP